MRQAPDHSGPAPLGRGDRAIQGRMEESNGQSAPPFTECQSVKVINHPRDGDTPMRKLAHIEAQRRHYARYERMSRIGKWWHRLNCMSTSH